MKKLPEKISECDLLKDKVKQLESETDIVKWYLAIMEKGIEAKTIITLYHEKCEKLQAECDTYEKQKVQEIPELHYQIDKLTRKNAKLTGRLETLELELKTQ